MSELSRIITMITGFIIVLHYVVTGGRKFFFPKFKPSKKKGKWIISGKVNPRVKVSGDAIKAKFVTDRSVRKTGGLN